MTQDYNQTLSNKASINAMQKRIVSNKRNARTRLLVQAGSLITLAGLFDVCGIEEGDDLQLDMVSRDKAAILLGILMETMSSLSPTPSQHKVDQWKQTGIARLKMASAKQYTNRRFRSS